MTHATELTSWIDLQPVARGQGWLDNLEERKREEAEFHDGYREGHVNEEHTASNHRFYEAATVVSDYRDQWLKRWAGASSATFLDFACGDGLLTIEAAKAGAGLAVGIDISEVSVRNAAESAEAAGVSATTRFLQRDCEDTGLPSDAFSACLCYGMLHHLDLTRALPELARIMRPGGRVLCVEALSYNPVIQLYRDRTPGLRTDWEKKHILGMREVRMAEEWFRVENVKFFLMASPLATFLPRGPLRRGGLAIGHAIDAVATRIPGLQLWSWQFAFELVKPAENS
ncbi:MAG: class I SAM-dependent methyltransferase [Gemmatimonadaceae bacterium]